MIQTGQVVVMVDYSDHVAGEEPVFSSGDLLFVLDARAEGELRCCKITPEGQIDRRHTDQLWSEEVIPVNHPAIRLHSRLVRQPAPARAQRRVARATRSDVEGMLQDPKSKDFRDLRDRGAHLYLTGGHATHLGAFFVGALCILSSDQDDRALTDPRTGAIQVQDEYVQRLALGDHPMVMTVRKLEAEGWKIRRSLDPNKRRPYTKVFMYRGEARITAQLDGSVLDHWGL